MKLSDTADALTEGTTHKLLYFINKSRIIIDYNISSFVLSEYAMGIYFLCARLSVTIVAVMS